jgi:hypothetical protein
MKRGTVAAALALAALLAPSVVLSAEARSVTSYQAWLVDPTSAVPRRGGVPVRIWVERFTPDSEASRLAEVVDQRGEQALKEALAEQELGRLSVGDRYVVPISYARRYVDERGEHLLLVAQRAISFREVFRGWRSKDYPYTAIQLDLREDGSGSGEVIAAAKFLPREDGTFDIDTLQAISSRLVSVRRVEQSAEQR